MAVIDVYVPCIPGMPIASGWESGKRAPTHQSGADGCPGEFGKPSQLFGAVGLDHATTDIEHRPLGMSDQLDRFLDPPRMSVDGRLVAGQVECLGISPGQGLIEDVLGEVDQNRPGPSGGCDVKSLVDVSAMSLGSVTK